MCWLYRSSGLQRLPVREVFQAESEQPECGEVAGGTGGDYAA